MIGKWAFADWSPLARIALKRVPNPADLPSFTTALNGPSPSSTRFSSAGSEPQHVDVVRELGPELGRLVAVMLMATVAATLLPLCLRSLVFRLQGPQGAPLGDFALLGAIGIILLASWIGVNQVFHKALTLSVRIRGLFERDFVKLLEKHPGRIARLGQRAILTFIERDLTTLQHGSRAFALLLFSIITLVMSGGIYIVFLGWSGVAGISVLLLASFGLRRISKILERVTASIAPTSGDRLSFTAFAFEHRRALLLSGYLPALQKTFSRLRTNEERGLRRLSVWAGVLSTLSVLTPLLVIIVSFTPALVSLHPPPAELLFPSLALLATLRSALFSVPNYLATIADGLGARRRAEEFLKDCSGVPPERDLSPVLPTRACSALIRVKPDVGMSESEAMLALTDELSRAGATAISPEGPWVLGRSICENVTFGLEVHEKRLAEVLRITCLDEDIANGSLDLDKQAREGDLSLSTGQLRRVAVARALYSNSSFTVLCRPTQNLDAKTATQLLERIAATSGAYGTIFYTMSEDVPVSSPEELLTVTGDRDVWREELHARLTPSQADAAAARTIPVPLANQSQLLPDQISPSVPCDLNGTRTSPSCVSQRPLQLRQLARMAGSWSFAAAFIGASLREIACLNIDLAYARLSSLVSITTAELLSLVALLSSLLLVAGGSTFFVSVFVTRICLKLMTTLSKRNFQCLVGEVTHDAATRLQDAVIGIASREQRIVDFGLGRCLADFDFVISLLCVQLAYAVLSMWQLAFIALPIALGYRRLYVRSRTVTQNLAVCERGVSERLLAETMDVIKGLEFLANLRRGSEASSRLGAFFRAVADARVSSDACDKLLGLRIDLIGASLFFVAILILVINHWDGCPVPPTQLLSVTLLYTLVAIFGRNSRIARTVDEVLVSVSRVAGELSPRDRPKVRTAGQAVASQPERAGHRQNEGVRIRAVDVAFAFPGASSMTLQGISFEVEPGERLGIAGRSGAGKSTLIDLIVGYKEPSSGRITIGESSAITQPSIAAGTVFTVGNPDPVFPPGPLCDAPSFLVADGRRDFAAGFLEENGICWTSASARAVTIGANGRSPLSTAERQILMADRIIRQRPRLVILDEPTSDMTNDLARKFLSAFFAALPATTFIVVSHHAAVLECMPRVLRLRDGMLVPQ